MMQAFAPDRRFHRVARSDDHRTSNMAQAWQARIVRRLWLDVQRRAWSVFAYGLLLIIVIGGIYLGLISP